MQTYILNIDSIEFFILLFMEGEELKLRYYILFLLDVLAGWEPSTRLCGLQKCIKCKVWAIPLKEKVFLQVSLVPCKQRMVCILVLKHGSSVLIKSQYRKNSHQQCIYLYRMPKNSMKREGKPLLSQAVSSCWLSLYTALPGCPMQSVLACRAAFVVDRSSGFTALQQEDSAATHRTTWKRWCLVLCLYPALLSFFK